jgi:transcriptional regulator with XRE-family HTH domain
MTLGQAIKKQRLKKQLLANYVAHKLGVSSSYFSMVESDIKFPTREMMSKICDALELDQKHFDSQIKKDLFLRYAAR